jgi:hypothetical protein
VTDIRVIALDKRRLKGKRNWPVTELEFSIIRKALKIQGLEPVVTWDDLEKVKK